MSFEPVISVRGVGKTYRAYKNPWHGLLARASGGRAGHYKEFHALDNVSFDVCRGEAVGIIGRNGSGKSTLLQIICGIRQPTAGSVAVRGRVAALLELGAGFSPEFTGRENVYMNAAIFGLSKEEVDARLDEILAFADIGEYIDQPVRVYSSGMFVRLAFAVIAHIDADILIIDEALSVGDAFFVQKCMRFLRKFMEHGTVIVVSHDTGAILSFCQKAVWLDKGEVGRIGTPKEVVESYLGKTYGDRQDTSATRYDEAALRSEPKPTPLRDMRLDFINRTQLRNDIELFTFSPDAQNFGLGGVTITDVRLTDGDSNPVSWVVGGEQVSLEIHCVANQDIFSPIIGFGLKDRLGQVLFGDNTYLAYATAPLRVNKGERFHAAFSFMMPILPVGKYAFDAAVAEGTQQAHVQHHWIHDAVAVESVTSFVASGLVGIPMNEIKLEVNK